MTFRGVTACLALGLLATACSDDEGSATPTTTVVDRTTSSTTTSATPERATSTTTTEFDPSSVEGQVEAAYLRSWDVYADAVYNLELDEEALAEVYAGEHLAVVTSEIERRIAEDGAALVDVEHSYTIQIDDSLTAHVVDRYQNHQVLIHPETKDPVEEDPDEELIDLVTMVLVDGDWKVTQIERLQ